MLLLQFLSLEKLQIQWQLLNWQKKKGAFVYGICNVIDSSIARITDAGSYTHAGPEIGVASTKAFYSTVNNSFSYCAEIR